MYFTVLYGLLMSFVMIFVVFVMGKVCFAMNGNELMGIIAQSLFRFFVFYLSEQG